MIYYVIGKFIDTVTSNELRIRDGVMKVKDGIIESFSETMEIPEKSIVYNFKNQLIFPGFSDLHVHAPQYSYAGTYMDLELLEWLKNYTYPEEAKYQDLTYAEKQYMYFVRDLLFSGTTHASIFATIHTDASLKLMELLEDTGLSTYVGKLQMDRNAPDYYVEETDEGVKETERFILESKRFKKNHPIITPRFTPSVTDKYMEEIGKLSKKYHVPMQSHLSENTDEIEWVQELRPDDEYYYESYLNPGLFGGDVKTVMAHCIYSSDKENEVMKDRNVFISHCPTSNTNVIAGICPAGKYLRNGYHIGLGSDCAGGHTLNMFEVMRLAIQVSKLRYKLVDSGIKPLKVSEVFYMATKGGGEFFDRIGSFDSGNYFDACVFDDKRLKNGRDFTDEERVERMIYLSDGIPVAKFCEGNKII